MATSSITHNFVLDAQTAVRFVEALDESRRNYVRLGTGNLNELKDPEEIKELAMQVWENSKVYAK